jgi:hypothetical protein
MKRKYRRRRQRVGEEAITDPIWSARIAKLLLRIGPKPLTTEAILSIGAEQFDELHREKIRKLMAAKKKIKLDYYERERFSYARQVLAAADCVVLVFRDGKWSRK